MSKNEALELLVALASVVATRYGIQHGLTQEKIDEFVREIANATREGAETEKSNEELKMVFSDIFKKYDLSDADFLKTEGG